MNDIEVGTLCLIVDGGKNHPEMDGYECTVVGFDCKRSRPYALVTKDGRRWEAKRCALMPLRPPAPKLITQGDKELTA